VKQPAPISCVQARTGVPCIEQAKLKNSGLGNKQIELIRAPEGSHIMKTWLVAILSLAAIFAVGAPAFAHHGGAATNDEITEFKNVTVTKFAWANPHCLVFFDVKGADGKVVNWAAETSAPQALILVGWEKTSLKPGDVITISLRTAKSGAPAGRFTKIVMADGTVLGDGGAGGGAPAASPGRGRGAR
jgi:hypothetical protein